jgi:Asp-tRNA(Asn)/Glu-tRNA(Gln) amidotransferase A subunit family amidase
MTPTTANLSDSLSLSVQFIGGPGSELALLAAAAQMVEVPAPAPR